MNINHYNRYFRILFVLMLLQFPYSCIVPCKDPDEHLRPEIQSIASRFGIYKDDVFEENSASIPSQVAAIGIYVDELEMHRVSQKVNVGFISGAYACDSHIWVEFVQQIEAISIVTDREFQFNDRSYQSGDPVNQLFEVANYDFISVNEFIDRQNEMPEIFGDWDSELILQLSRET